METTYTQEQFEALEERVRKLEGNMNALNERTNYVDEPPIAETLSGMTTEELSAYFGLADSDLTEEEKQEFLNTPIEDLAESMSQNDIEESNDTDSPDPVPTDEEGEDVSPLSGNPIIDLLYYVYNNKDKYTPEQLAAITNAVSNMVSTTTEARAVARASSNGALSSSYHMHVPATRGLYVFVDPINGNDDKATTSNLKQFMVNGIYGGVDNNLFKSIGAAVRFLGLIGAHTYNIKLFGQNVGCPNVYHITKEECDRFWGLAGVEVHLMVDSKAGTNFYKKSNKGKNTVKPGTTTHVVLFDIPYDAGGKEYKTANGIVISNVQKYFGIYGTYVHIGGLPEQMIYIGRALYDKNNKPTDTVLSENNTFDPNAKIAMDIIAKKYKSATPAEKGRLAGLWFCFHGIGLFIKHCWLYANVAFEHNASLNVEPGTSKKLYNTTTKTVNGKKITETVNRHIHVSNSAKDIGGHSSNFKFWTYLD